MQARPGIVHQSVDPAESFEGRAHDCGHIGCRVHVGANSQGSAELVRQCAQPVDPAGRENRVRARGVQGAGGGLADS